jgi:membrane associated rhomboid family serine protease
METCYRHPGRETGVACSNCGRPICPDCMTSTSVGMRCPECARQRTKVRTARTIEREPTLTYALIAVNVALSLGSLLSGQNLASPGGSRLVGDGWLYGPAVADGELWRLVTSGFLHAGPLHLIMNMFGLYILGTLLEPRVGRLRFGLIYLVSLLAGSFGALLLQPHTPTLGASGAIFGLLGAALVFLRARGVSPMESGLGAWIAINLLFTFAIPGISIGAHVGGLAGGAIAAALLFDVGERTRLPGIVPAALVALLGALAVVASVAVAAG